MTADLRYTSDPVELWRIRICPRCGGEQSDGALRCRSCMGQSRPFLPVHWVDDALCRQTDPEAFFPIGSESPDAAKAVCAECPVAAACLTYAIEARLDHGVWGGTTAQERAILRRRVKEGRA